MKVKIHSPLQQLVALNPHPCWATEVNVPFGKWILTLLLLFQILIFFEKSYAALEKSK